MGKGRLTCGPERATDGPMSAPEPVYTAAESNAALLECLPEAVSASSGEQLEGPSPAAQGNASALAIAETDWAARGLDERRIDVLAAYGVPVDTLPPETLRQMDGLIAQAEREGRPTALEHISGDCTSEQRPELGSALDPSLGAGSTCGVQYTLGSGDASMQLGSYGADDGVGASWLYTEDAGVRGGTGWSEESNRLQRPPETLLHDPTEGIGLSDPLGDHLRRVADEKALERARQRSAFEPYEEPGFMEKYGSVIDYGARTLQFGMGATEAWLGGMACASGPLTGVGFLGCALAANGVDNMRAAVMGDKTVLGKGVEAGCGTFLDDDSWESTACEIASETLITGGMGAGAVRGLPRSGKALYQADDAARGLTGGVDELARGGKGVLPSASDDMGKVATGSSDLAGAAKPEGLIHITTPEAAESILADGSLRGRGGIYATPGRNASLTPGQITRKTGLRAKQQGAVLDLPEQAADAFQRPVPMGPFTGWQWMNNTHLSDAGHIDMLSGEFVRSGANWNQRLIYGLDGMTNLLGGGAVVSTKSD